MSIQDKLILRVVERYLYHKNYKTDNSVIATMKENMCDLELSEMWMLTQH